MAGAHKEGSVQERNFLLKKDGPRIRNVSLHHQGFGTALRCLACWRMIGMDQTERVQQFMTIPPIHRQRPAISAPFARSQAGTIFSPPLRPRRSFAETTATPLPTSAGLSAGVVGIHVDHEARPVVVQFGSPQSREFI